MTNFVISTILLMSKYFKNKSSTDFMNKNYREGVPLLKNSKNGKIDDFYKIKPILWIKNIILIKIFKKIKKIKYFTK